MCVCMCPCVSTPVCSFHHTPSRQACSIACGWGQVHIACVCGMRCPICYLCAWAPPGQRHTPTLAAPSTPRTGLCALWASAGPAHSTDTHAPFNEPLRVAAHSKTAQGGIHRACAAAALEQSVCEPRQGFDQAQQTAPAQAAARGQRQGSSLHIRVPAAPGAVYALQPAADQKKCAVPCLASN